MTLKASVVWSGVWVGLALLFNAFLWFYLMQNYALKVANEKALEFFTAYLVEETLSMDNVFVFLVIFKYFAIPINFQRRLLLFGVLGAIALRLVFISMGIWLIHRFDWVFYIFGLLLIYSAIRIFAFHDGEQSLSDNLILRGLRRIFPLTESIASQTFWVKKNKRYYLTPLFIVLIFVEISDLIFAMDSIPAVFGITNDPFIAFTSNVFAVLGLRAMYFILATMHERFLLLKYGLAFILCFIGAKMLLHHVVDISIFITLAIITLTLFTSIALSKLIHVDVHKD
ncbi:integral membrane protein, TerC family [Legionella oakridgensis ATCC 33761 = DSM 21215]|uniref:Integral membrane protein, TerC family n=2 Tax=Legionella oakridgensis TaxID=29423 RepID=W0B8I0_9GAMM|nr:TerC/Alx family metal homeostasis membrane protein [Legionella oakridgensis]AHE66175.1 integral membrane protein, TerC family [Legionella oakridgensis ATCC 33761 = DSM 21215]